MTQSAFPVGIERRSAADAFRAPPCSSSNVLSAPASVASICA
eukprot:CAMPEP_0184387554 /NCGR_PEP_ID=MMETSP0007-20130409/10838_1 /TAXON_ID=97485 /ORGANISM="Prymnesium parvum, Strain Texoma1" /LENGTH=41 /DNA_ID= /DNA_START= /DNA_END= /DNA_ORIENTATION=